MKQRVITGVLLILLLVVLLWLPGWCMALATLIAIGFATWEEYHALTLAEHRVVSWPAWVVLIGSVPLARLLDSQSLVPLMALLIKGFIGSFCSLTVVLPGLSMVALSLADQKAVEVVLMALVFTVPLLGDTFALFVGSAVGGRKLCPQVSPHKTVAGAIGGLAGSVLGAMIVCGIAALVCNEATLAKLPSWWAYLGLGLLGGAVGQIGDLFASLVKRHSGIKDFSNLFPGHGGMLDRLDSVLFMAVLMFCYRIFTV